MILNPTDIPQKDRYKLLIGTVLPRPIAWVSTMNGAGQLNLAPFSYFTVASTNPMTLLFCPQVQPSGAPKDTLRNIEEVPEFVINLTNEETVEAMNLSATILPYGESEFEWAGVTPAPSETIRAPRVAEAPVAFECTLQRIVVVSDQPGGGAVVFGEVQRIHIRDDIYVDSYVLLDQLKPVGRIAGMGYTRVTDTFDLPRVPPPQRD
jgi:flavin reductase (DIM6/NTAB) family NADH-FMN oxidoreductase RutF